MAGSWQLGPQLRDRAVALLRGPSWRRIAVVRRVGAAVLAALALGLALTQGTAQGETLVVAARDLTAGATLRPGDLAVLSWPAHLVPIGTLREVADGEGRVLVGPARTGEPVTDVRLVGAELTARLSGSSDAAAVPVRLADPDVAALLVPGSRVDVVTAGPRAEEPVLLAANAAVLAVLPPAEGTGAGTRGRLVLVTMPRAVATRVAAAALSEQVAVTLR